jgi:hypothetical protein
MLRTVHCACMLLAVSWVCCHGSWRDGNCPVSNKSIEEPPFTIREEQLSWSTSTSTSEIKPLRPIVPLISFRSAGQTARLPATHLHYSHCYLTSFSPPLVILLFQPEHCPLSLWKRRCNLRRPANLCTS